MVSTSVDGHLRFDAFEWRDCQKRLCKTSSKTRDHSLRARNLAIFVLEEGLEEVKGDKTWIQTTNKRGSTRRVEHRPVISNLRMPALAEFPMISVVHPAYHWLPNGGHGNFLPSGNLRLSCVRVLATGCLVSFVGIAIGSGRTLGGVCDC